MQHARRMLHDVTENLEVLKRSSSGLCIVQCCDQATYLYIIYIEPISEEDIKSWSTEMIQNLSRDSCMGNFSVYMYLHILL